MPFYEPLFLSLFLTLYTFYSMIRSVSGKKLALLFFSLLFYLWAEPSFVPILFVSAVLDYVLSFQLSDQNSRQLRRLALVIGITENLAILIVYKYANFLISNLNLTLNPFGLPNLPIVQVALPIGVSFVVFEKITYLVDTYRGVSQPAALFSDYLLFVMFFPKLLAGPILKYHEIMQQIASPPAVGWTDFWAGLLRFGRGAGRKLLIADPLAPFVSSVFGSDPSRLSVDDAWLGVGCFTIQLYFDFAGYSDMAIGLARMLGFELNENFNSPYVARSLTDYWRRWHISLTTWIRDYLYLPLGGNRHGVLRTYLNLWICFLVSGLWHGPNWNFVLWGAYNGLILTLDRLFLRQALERSGALVSLAFTLFVIMIGRAIFRCEDSAHLLPFISAMFGLSNGTVEMTVSREVLFTFTLGAFMALLPATPIYSSLIAAHQKRRAVRGITAAALIVVCVLAIARAVATPFQPFIYFRF
jgi:alginate O-acetyltransferase complex protein AlgI